jgi:hypothetical protein
MDLIFLLLAVCLGYFIGWHHHAFTTIQRMINHPDMFLELIKKLKEVNKDQEDTVETANPSAIRTEFLQGQCYVYDGEQFLAQGADLREALSNAEKRFPGQYNFTLRLTNPNKSNQSS